VFCFQTSNGFLFSAAQLTENRLTMFPLLAMKYTEVYANVLWNVSEISSRIPDNNRQQLKQKAVTREADQ